MAISCSARPRHSSDFRIASGRCRIGVGSTRLIPTRGRWLCRSRRRRGSRPAAGGWSFLSVRLELTGVAAYRRPPPAATLPKSHQGLSSMKVAQAISRALVSEGVTLAAGIAGQSIWPVIDAIGDCEEISLMYARQERVAFDICDGFARASGNPAVVFTDAGPAAANLMGGIVNSWGDSVPVLFLAGHNERTKTAAKYTKELPFLDVFGPVSKWAAMIDDPSKVSEVLRRAFMHMRTGRPGPVALGLPVDVCQMEVGNFEYTPVSTSPRVRSGADPDAVERALALIAGAERPYVYVGAGVLFSEATAELVRFAELLSLPVATTLNGKSAFPENHPLALGIGGFGRASYGSLPATMLGENADVIFTVGCGFKQHATIVRPSARIKHIQIDVDPSEMNRDHVADVAILGDAKVVLRQLCDAASRLPAVRQKPVVQRTQ